MPQVILIGKEWQARALLGAQLVEEGVEIEAFESVGSALRTREESEPAPALILMDLTASDDPSSDSAQLASWARRTSIWIIASRAFITSHDLNGKGFELVLFRPVDLGELVKQIKLKLKV